jgi:integrase
LTHPAKSEESAIRAAGALHTIIERLRSYGVKYCYKLTSSHIDHYRRDRLKDKPHTSGNATISPRTVDIEVQNLKFAFNRGLKQSWVNQNPIQHVELLRAGPRKIVTPLKPHECRSLLRAATDTWRPMIYFFLTTGCRRKEGCLVEWSHIDRDRKCIRLVHTKTGREREIGLTADMLDWLNNNKNNHKYIFSTPQGNPRINNFGRELAITAQRAAIGHHVHPHLLRHTFGTLLAYSDVSPFEIQELLGHEDLKTTQIYVHYARKYRDPNAVQLSQWLSEQVRGHHQPLVKRPDQPMLQFPSLETAALKNQA